VAKVQDNSGNSVVRKFHHDDAGLLRYREEHRSTGYIASIGDWLHLYPLSSDQAFSTPLPHTPAEAREGYKRNTLTGSRPKLCVAKASHVPSLIKEVIALAPNKRWGASGAPAELSKALECRGLTLAADGTMLPITNAGPSAVTPHNVSRSAAKAAPKAAKPSTRNPWGSDTRVTLASPKAPIKQIRKSPDPTEIFESNSFVYFIEARYADKLIAIKIGSAKKPRNRLRALQGGCPIELRIVRCIKGGPSRESEMHQRFRKERMPPIGSLTNRQWSFEWFEPSTRLLNFIKKTLRKEDVGSL
jgi:hypothetical protein